MHNASDIARINNTVQKPCFCCGTFDKSGSGSPRPSTAVRTQGKIDLRNESGRPMKVKVVGEVSEK